jgi:hypothetical protein
MSQSCDFEKRKYSKAFQLGKICAHYTARRMEKVHIGKITDMHLSLASGASYEYTRESGGKWNIIKEGQPFHVFLNTDISEVFELDGNSYRDPYGNLVCESWLGNYPTWKVAYLTEPLHGSFAEGIEPYFSMENEFYKGIDCRLGRLLFIFSKLEKEKNDRASMYPAAKVAVVTEPGCKIRPVTAGETWLNLFLSPAGHFFKEHLENLPGARVGLVETDHLWRFGNSHYNHYGESTPKENKWISSSDLTSATDRARHDVSRGLLCGYAEGLLEAKLIDSGTMNYLKEASSLLCSPRLLSYSASQREIRDLPDELRERLIFGEKRRTGSGKTMQNVTWATARGVLMGEPLTKCLLTLSSMASWIATRFRFNTLEDVNIGKYYKRLHDRNFVRSSVRLFYCAGDDHTGVGKLKDLQQIPKFQESMGFEISWDKYRISQKYVHYCQDFGFHPNIRPKVYQDSPRLRLLNQFRKEGARDNFETPDPIPGKVKDLERRLRFFRENADGVLKELSIVLSSSTPLVLRHLMPSFFEKKILLDPKSYLPTWLGGMGIPLGEMGWESSSKFSTSHLGPEAMLYATQFAEYKGMDDFTKVKIWERGITQQVNAFNVMKDIGIPQEDILTGEQAFETIRRVLDDTSSYSTRTSNKRIAKTLFRDFVDISKPVTMLTAKEIPYTTIPRGEAAFETVSTNSRARQIMLKNVRKFKKFVPQHITTEFERSRTINSGLWVERSDLARLSGTQFVKPSLHFNTSFLMKPSKENRDDRVHRTVPLIPMVPPEELHEYRNYVLEQSGEFKGRNPDSKYKKTRSEDDIEITIEFGEETINRPVNEDASIGYRQKVRNFLYENLLLEEDASDEAMLQLVERAWPEIQERLRKRARDSYERNASIEQEFLQPIGFSDGEGSDVASLTLSTSYSSIDRLPDDTSEDTDLTLPSTDEETEM